MGAHSEISINVDPEVPDSRDRPMAKIGVVAQAAEKRVSKGSAMPHPKGRGPSVPNFLGRPTCAHTISETTTKFHSDQTGREESFFHG